MSDDIEPVEDISSDAAPIDTTPAEPAQPKEDKGADTRKRIARLTYEREEARRELAAFKAIQPAPVQDFNSQVETRASEKVAHQKFNDECNATHAAGVKEFPDFVDALRSFEDIGGLAKHTDFLDTINALPNGAAVLRHLGLNLDEASELLDLKPARMAMKLAMLSGEIAKPIKRPVSNTPAPPDRLGSGAPTSARDPDKMSPTEFAAWRAEERKTRR